jgi:hypothetical protein
LQPNATRFGGRQDYIDNLTLMRGLDFDVLVTWGATQDEPPIAAVSPAEAAARLDTIIQRVEVGGNRYLTEATEKGLTGTRDRPSWSEDPE